MAITDLAGVSLQDVALAAADAAHAAATSGVHGLRGQLAWFAYKGANQNIPNGFIPQIITWSAELYDVGNDFDLANNRYQAPANVKVHWTLQLFLDDLPAANDTWTIYIYHQPGPTIACVHQVTNVSVGVDGHFTISGDRRMNLGTQLEVYALHSSGVGENILGGVDDSYFCGFVIPQST